MSEVQPPVDPRVQIPRTDPRVQIPRTEPRVLILQFRVKADEELRPDEFSDLFRLADQLSAYAILEELHDVMDALPMPSRWKFDVLSRLRAKKRVPSAVPEVATVRRGSWEFDVCIQSVAVAWILKEYLHPVVKEAWNESQFREVIKRFLRDKIFGGAKRKIETKASETPKLGNLRIVEVSLGEGPTDSQEKVVVLVEKIKRRLPPITEEETIEAISERVRG